MPGVSVARSSTSPLSPLLDAGGKRRYTLPMKYRRLICALALLCLWLSACSPGHSGDNTIAFLRDGQLWTIYADGTGAYELSGSGPSVIGYGWSPDHHLLVFRMLDDRFAASAAGRHVSPDALTGLVRDLPSGLNTVGVDGGSPIPIVFSSSSVNYSDAWWNPSGTRLLYRITLPGTSALLRWQLAQSDQPGGIASKVLPSSQAIPSLGTSLALGMASDGIFSVDFTGGQRQILVPGPLGGAPLPASLERVLWQPQHAQPAFLYAQAVAGSGESQRGTVEVALLLHHADGQTTTLATCSCQQFAWSSDGTHVLYTTGTRYVIVDLAGKVVRTIEADPQSVPSWSPDGRFLLIDGRHSLWLVDVERGQQQQLLSDQQTPPTSVPGQPLVPTAAALLQPVPNSPWAADSRRLLFLTRSRLWWEGQPLTQGNGLYEVALDAQGRPASRPLLLATGAITQIGWTYQNSNTSFLF